MKNFKQICFGAVTMAVMTMGTALTADSAQAAILDGSTLRVTGSAKLLDVVDVTSGIDIYEVQFLQGGILPGQILYQENVSSGSFGPTGPANSSSGPGGVYVNTKNLTLQKTAADLWELQAPVTDFIRQGAGSTGYGYNLLSFILKEQTVVLGGIPNIFYLASSTGTFFDYSDSTSIGAGGPFSAQTNNFILSGTTISGDITAKAVPAPALLPGLLGLGAAAWRKRKSEKEAVAA
jgi:hypothetical protein